MVMKKMAGDARPARDELGIAERRVLRLEGRVQGALGAESGPGTMGCIARSVEKSLSRLPKGGYLADLEAFSLAQRTIDVLAVRPEIPGRMEAIGRLCAFQRQRMAPPESIC